MAQDTRRKIIQNATKLIMGEGVARLTLADVAKRAGISKGGLLYHFPSKEDLIIGMIQDSLRGFAEKFARFAGESEGDGAWTRAYVRASFPEEDDMMAAPMLAGIATDPKLLDSYADDQAGWARQLHEDGIEKIHAEVIRLAADGLFFNEALGLRPLSARDRARFIQRLIDMATPGGATPGGATPGGVAGKAPAKAAKKRGRKPAANPDAAPGAGRGGGPGAGGT